MKHLWSTKAKGISSGVLLLKICTNFRTLSIWFISVCWCQQPCVFSPQMINHKLKILVTKWLTGNNISENLFKSSRYFLWVALFGMEVLLNYNLVCPFTYWLAKWLVICRKFFCACSCFLHVSNEMIFFSSGKVLAV